MCYASRSAPKWPTARTKNYLHKKSQEYRRCLWPDLHMALYLTPPHVGGVFLGFKYEFVPLSKVDRLPKGFTP